ncbi:GntR family transcriptional regulator [Streptomyces sp. NPDC090052]|uniref:GntR family transcriptional regulator n=1 Tax=Streptomyces sp. NPDC090052 TaxID=3365931 RepID=UPI00382633FD
MPIRRQVIADDLRNQIATGQLKTGERLPSEALLAVQYEVSTPTLRSALALLQGEGLVEKIHGKGNFVRHGRRRITYVGGGRTPFRAGQIVSAERITISTTNLGAEGHLVALLGVPPHSPLTEILCICHEDGMPHSLARIYVPRDLSPAGESGAPVSEQRLGAWLGEPRPPLAEIRERVTARPPKPEETAALRISSSLAVLDVTRAAVDTTGRVVEATLLVLPGDRADAYFLNQLPSPQAENDG